MSRLARLSSYLNTPLSRSRLPAYPTTFLKLKTLSLIGGAVYTLAASQASRPVSKDGKVDFGVVVRECIEEGRDRWWGWGWDGEELERRKRERRKLRRKEEKEEMERRERLRAEEKRRFVLFRWGRRPRR